MFAAPEDKEKGKNRGMVCFFGEMSSQGLIMKNFVPKERDPEIPEHKKNWLYLS